MNPVFEVACTSCVVVSSLKKEKKKVYVHKKMNERNMKTCLPTKIYSPDPHQHIHSDKVNPTTLKHLMLKSKYPNDCMCLLNEILKLTVMLKLNMDGAWQRLVQW